MAEHFEKFIHKDYIRQEYEFSSFYRYLDKYRRADLYEVERLGRNTTAVVDKTIWVMWLQGIEKAPELVKKCCDSIDKNKPDGFQTILLTLHNLSEYITLPDYIWEKYNGGIISSTHLSDIIRIELLATYGGCWIDATVFCGDKIPAYMLSDMFMFKLESVLSSPVIKISSWWMSANAENRIIHAARHMLYEYWKYEERLHSYFLLHIIMSKVIDEDSACQAIFQSIPYFNSRNAHVLQGKLGMQHSDAEWQIIKRSSAIQKLSYKTRYIQGDGYNYYTALLEGKLN